MKPLILFPSYYMSLDCEPDFKEEMDAASNHFKVGTFDFDMFVSEGILKTSVPLKGESILLRSYMMHDWQYELLSNAIERKGGKLLTDFYNYSRLHYADGYMPYVYMHCMATELVTIDTDNIDYTSLRDAIKRLNCDKIFIKDYVKSAKAYMPTIFDSQWLYDNLETIIPKFIEIRGKNFNKGIVLKEAFSSDIYNESRAFISYGKLVSHDANLFNVETDMAKSNAIIDMLRDTLRDVPFFTVDFAYLKNGDVKVIECGDGQVSGLATGANVNSFYFQFDKSLSN